MLDLIDWMIAMDTCPQTTDWTMKIMDELRLLPILAALLVSLGITACVGESQSDADATGQAEMAAESGEEREGSGEHSEGEEGRESEGEHGGEGEEGRESEGEHGGEGEEGEHGGEEAGHGEGGEEGEEPGIYIAQGDTWDMTRRGARLVLSYNAQRDAFVGRVENTTDARMCAIRVEVHVGGGPELGPTARTDVPAGEAIDIVLSAEGNAIKTWTAHPELSACG
jgi:hypothetical protein